MLRYRVHMKWLHYEDGCINVPARSPEHAIKIAKKKWPECEVMRVEVDLTKSEK